MSNELIAMVDLRHSAEQRGEYEALGRLINLQTAHGLIEFPPEHGEFAGPDIGLAFYERRRKLSAAESKNSSAVYYDLVPIPEDLSAPLQVEVERGQSEVEFGIVFILLGAWAGLPALRHLSNEQCPKCKRSCDICGGVGTKQCEGLDCGGRGFIYGFWKSCPGPGCHKDTGQFKEGCATCATSPVKGQIREELECPMCKGTKIIPCSACRGTKKRSTGHVNGSLDYQSPLCKTCRGSGRKGEWQPQDVKKLTNAVLVRSSVVSHERAEKPLPKKVRVTRTARNPQSFLVLGPIHSFVIQDFSPQKRVRMFEVERDSEGDFLNLLVPEKPGQNRRAYLVGGVVRERAMKAGAA